MCVLFQTKMLFAVALVATTPSSIGANNGWRHLLVSHWPTWFLDIILRSKELILTCCEIGGKKQFPRFGVRCEKYNVSSSLGSCFLKFVCRHTGFLLRCDIFFSDHLSTIFKNKNSWPVIYNMAMLYIQIWIVKVHRMPGWLWVNADSNTIKLKKI